MTLSRLAINDRTFLYAPIADTPDIDRLPYSLRVVLENLTRQAACGMRNSTTVAAEIDNLLNRRVGSGLSMFPNRIFG